MGLLVDRQTTSYVLRVMTEENADRILLNGNLSADFRQICLSCVQQLFCLSRIGERTRAVMLKRRHEFKRIPTGLYSVVGDLQLGVQAAKLKIGLSNTFDQS